MSYPFVWELPDPPEFSGWGDLIDPNLVHDYVYDGDEE